MSARAQEATALSHANGLVARLSPDIARPRRSRWKRPRAVGIRGAVRRDTGEGVVNKQRPSEPSAEQHRLSGDAVTGSRRASEMQRYLKIWLSARLATFERPHRVLGSQSYHEHIRIVAYSMSEMATDILRQRTLKMPRKSFCVDVEFKSSIYRI